MKDMENSTKGRSYQFDDLNPITGTTYYRLQQIDFDGSFSYSQIIATTNNIDSDIHIYPNPAKGLLFVQVPPTLIGQPHQIINALGQSVQAGNIEDANCQIVVQDLQSGLYVLLINGGESKKSFLVKD